MHVFSITIHVENHLAKEWMIWIKEKLQPILADRSLVEDFRLLKVLPEEPAQGISYSFQFQVLNAEKFPIFESRFNVEVAEEMNRMYKENCLEFRTKLELIDW